MSSAGQGRFLLQGGPFGSLPPDVPAPEGPGEDRPGMEPGRGANASEEALNE